MFIGWIHGMTLCNDIGCKELLLMDVQLEVFDLVVYTIEIIYIAPAPIQEEYKIILTTCVKNLHQSN